MSAYTKGVKNGAIIGDAFKDGDLVVGSVVIAANATNVTVAHGLSAAPDFVLLGTDENSAVADRMPYVASKDGTNMVLAHTDTDGAAQTVFYLAGVLAS